MGQLHRDSVTKREEIEEIRKIIQCPCCTSIGPLTLEHDLHQGLFKLGCAVCGQLFINFEDT